MNIVIKRIYDQPDERDGYRVLVDRLWPRGISKKDAQLHDWWKSIAPSHQLRLWYGHKHEKWKEFTGFYQVELSDKSDTVADLLAQIDLRKKLTLLYAAKDSSHNHAVVLKEFLERNVK